MEFKSHNTGTVIAATIFAIILIIGLILLGTWVALLLWEGVMVAAFGLPMLTYWQMFGLIILARILIPFGTTTTNSTKE